MGRSDPSGVGCIVLVTIVVLSMCAPTAAAGSGTATTELVVESQDRIDDDGNLGSAEDSDDDNVYASIQAAVDAAPDGAEINVTAGTYNESVVVDKPNLKLTGDTGGMSAGAAGNAPVLDSGNTETTAIKVMASADNVVIEGLQIKNYNTFGVYPEVGSRQTADGITIRDNTVSNVYIATAILSTEDDAVLKNVSVTNNDFTSVGFGVNMRGDTGVSDIEDVDISDNTISGASADGIQVWASTGIAEIRDVTVSGNTIDTVKRRGIELVLEGGSGDSSITSVDVVQNTVTNARVGVDMRTPSGGDISSVDIYRNDLRNNKFGTRFESDTTNDIAVTHNVYEGNTNYAIRSINEDLLVATDNWYGDASGPTISSNPGGSGDAVSENVTYDPFLTRTVEVGDAAAPIGETATVDVTADAANVAGYELTVEFNESALEVTDVAGADLSDPTVDVDNENGVVSFTQAETSGSDEPTLARIDFNVTDAGESNVTVDNADSALFDVDGESISSVSYEKGVVENDEPGDGDVDGDGNVDAGDVVLLQRYIVGEDVDIDTEAADVNGDGNVDAGDALLIQREIVDG